MSLFCLFISLEKLRNLVNLPLMGWGVGDTYISAVTDCWDDSGRLENLNMSNPTGYPEKFESELASLRGTRMVTAVAAVMMLLSIVLPESPVRSVMA